MASSLLTLLDDIASVLDDVAVMTKVAAKKTAGVLGDDLALNAQQVSGVKPDRELPVVWAVARGSVRNKLILVPAALAISALVPVLIVPLLMIGGAYLCYEGFEKLAHRFLQGSATAAVEHAAHASAVADPAIDLVAYEREKIAGAVRTDFILSAEIIVIALGTVADVGFARQVAVLVGIAVIMTVGVYGLVAGIVKLDDAGLYLSRKASAAQRAMGRGLLVFAPLLMKTLSVVGTVAMFMVGGGILSHGLVPLHHGIAVITQASAAVVVVGPALAVVMPTLLDMLAGIVVGGLVLLAATGSQRAWKIMRPAAGRST